MFYHQMNSARHTFILLCRYSNVTSPQLKSALSNLFITASRPPKEYCRHTHCLDCGEPSANRNARRCVFRLPRIDSSNSAADEQGNEVHSGEERPVWAFFEMDAPGLGHWCKTRAELPWESRPPHYFWVYRGRRIKMMEEGPVINRRFIYWARVIVVVSLDDFLFRRYRRRVHGTRYWRYEGAFAKPELYRRLERRIT